MSQEISYLFHDQIDPQPQPQPRPTTTTTTTTMTTTTDLETAARAQWVTGVRDAYLLTASLGSHRPIPLARIAHWDGGPDDYGRIRPSTWRELADHLLRHGCLDPQTYVQAQASDRRLPDPHLLRDDDCLQRYHRAAARQDMVVGILLRNEPQRLELAWRGLCAVVPGITTERALASVLLDPMLQVSPLMRYCAAAAEGLPELTAMLRQVALWQLLPWLPEYGRHWRAILPAELVADATALRSHCLSRL